MQIPSNMLLTRLRPSLYLPFWVVVWSIVSASTAAVQNYPQLVAVRILLGVSEAPFFPGNFFLASLKMRHLILTLSRCLFPHVVMVHAPRIGTSDGYLVLRPDHRDRLLWSHRSWRICWNGQHSRVGRLARE